jgi:hypothetical protein
MVRGLDVFRERVREFEGSFILIGGAACDQWFTDQGLAFRATKDLDIVLLIEVLNREVVAAFRRFVEDGGYEIRERTEGKPVLYRFAKPKDERFPYTIELFSRNPENFDLTDEQTIIPVKVEPDHHSLSAILIDEPYYRLIQTHQEGREGLRFATATALIPLKARAWLDLTARQAAGEKIDSKNMDKHRNDVFRLAATLPGEAGPALADEIVADIGRFIAAFPEASEEWPRILNALKPTFGGRLRAASLIAAIETYFRLTPR